MGTTKKQAIKIATQHAKGIEEQLDNNDSPYSPEHKMDKYQLSLLNSIMQTQGMGMNEYMIEEVVTNVLL